MEEDTNEYTYQAIPKRALSAETLRFYDIQAKVNSEGKPIEIGFRYPSGATKVRPWDDSQKSFKTVGEESARKQPSLFGADKFSAGSAKAITITEGEYDAPSVFEMLGSKYPAVSVRSSSQARADCSAFYDYLNSFEEIYLCFDNDEQGQKATQQVASLFDFNKVKHVKLTRFKDANDYLQSGADKEFKSIWYNAKRFLPEGIISSYREIDRIIDEGSATAIASYPFGTLQELTGGARAGEVVLFTAQEGIGKTEILRAIEYHLLKNTDENIGILHLEEAKLRTIQGFAGLELGRPVHLPDQFVGLQEVKDAYRQVTRRDERVNIYSHFGSDDPDVLLGMVRFLAGVAACKFIFFDHITMAVTGLADEDERKALDYISTNLKMMMQSLGCVLFMVSHVNDEKQTRGSRNIGKVADTRIHLERDLLHENVNIRNTTELMVYKNRYTGRTGPAGKLLFDPLTYRLDELTKVQEALPPKKQHEHTDRTPRLRTHGVTG